MPLVIIAGARRERRECEAAVVDLIDREHSVLARLVVGRRASAIHAMLTEPLLLIQFDLTPDQEAPYLGNRPLSTHKTPP
jgi:hypothetical protein